MDEGIISWPSSEYLCPAWLAIIVTSAILYITFVLVFDSLSHVPSLHWSTPFTRLYQLYTVYYHDRHFANYDAHMPVSGKRPFRPVVRVGPNEITLMTASGVRTVYGGNFEKAAWYEVFSNYRCVNS